MTTDNHQKLATAAGQDKTTWRQPPAGHGDKKQSFTVTEFYLELNEGNIFNPIEHK